MRNTISLPMYYQYVFVFVFVFIKACLMMFGERKKGNIKMFHTNVKHPMSPHSFLVYIWDLIQNVKKKMKGYLYELLLSTES